MELRPEQGTWWFFGRSIPEFDVSRYTAIRDRTLKTSGRVSTPLNTVGTSLEPTVPAAFKVARVSREITLQRAGETRSSACALFVPATPQTRTIDESFLNCANKRSSTSGNVSCTKTRTLRSFSSQMFGVRRITTASPPTHPSTYTMLFFFFLRLFVWTFDSHDIPHTHRSIYENLRVRIRLNFVRF